MPLKSINQADILLPICICIIVHKYEIGYSVALGESILAPNQQTFEQTNKNKWENNNNSNNNNNNNLNLFFNTQKFIKSVQTGTDWWIWCFRKRKKQIFLLTFISCL